jgi:UDP-hydrolysing UDP-N-acetyl-D-glucosamine 2-epimerase
MRKIVYITGTRADYGLMRYALKEIESRVGLDLAVVATGMHLMGEFGCTVSEIESECLEVHRLDATYESDDKPSMARFAGRLIQLLTDKLEELNPDVILLLGDRGEMLAGAIAGAYLSIPVAHVHGGDVTSTVDDLVRNAITKLSQIHMAATRKSAERIASMGEDPSRIFTVGAPGLDSIFKEAFSGPEEIRERYELDISRPLLMVIQHPVTLEAEHAGDQMRETLEATLGLGRQTIVIYPNADAGGRKMIEAIEEYKCAPNLKSFKSLPRRDFLGMMKIAGAIIGNSSSGIIEAPSLCLPAINIGSRQRGRERGENVIDAGYDRDEIASATLRALYDEEFRKRVLGARSPYGDGNAGKRIADILSNIEIDESMLQKRTRIALEKDMDERS